MGNKIKRGGDFREKNTNEYNIHSDVSRDNPIKNSEIQGFPGRIIHHVKTNVVATSPKVVFYEEDANKKTKKTKRSSKLKI